MDINNLAQRLLDFPDRIISYYHPLRSVQKPYVEVFADVESVQSKLESWGVKPGMRIGFLSESSYDWIVYEIALLRMRCVCVCFPQEEFANIALDELAEKYALHLLLISEKEQKRRKETREWVALLNRDNTDDCKTRRPDDQPHTTNRAASALSPDVLTLVFSSGSTGKLKCLLISKRGTEEWINACGRSLTFRPDDSVLVAIPLSNYQQRQLIYTAIWYGFNIVLTDPALLFRALKEARPTFLVGPPMFYEVLENRFRSLPPSRQLLLSMGGRIIKTLTGGRLRDELLRKWFAPFYNAFGGRVRLMLTGSAPSRQSTLELYALMGLPLYQGYGLGEIGMVAMNLPGANRIGSVGKIMQDVSVVLAQDGEIIVNYDNPVCLGYLYVDEQEENQFFLSPTSFATGDMGRVDKDGYLYIIGRKKQIIITQGGYKIQPESLEREIEKSPDVSRAVVFGGGELPDLVALVSLRTSDSPATRQKVQSLVDKVNANVPPASKISRLVFTTDEFRMDNGLLTRNLKVDRQAVYEKFRVSLVGSG